MFAASGARLAYLVEVAGGTGVVVDGVLQGPYPNVLDDTLRVSRDGRQVAYAAVAGGSARVVLDGVDGPDYDAVVTVDGPGPVFVAPSRVRYLGIRDDIVYEVESGSVGVTASAAPPGQRGAIPAGAAR